MGCVPSKEKVKQIKEGKLPKNGDNFAHHIVSLTSSTYGVLRLDKEKKNQSPHRQGPEATTQSAVEALKMSPSVERPAEIINAWELMAGLEDKLTPARKSPKSRPLLRSLIETDSRSPMKIFKQVGSPRKTKKIVGKENKGRANAGSTENSPNRVQRDSNCNNPKESAKKPSPRLWASIKGSPKIKRSESSSISQLWTGSSRRSLGPYFDPELVASFEREVSEEEEEIKKKMISTSSAQTPKRAKNSHESDAILESYKKKCPPAGQNAIILYTTTLRSIRKTFEECNQARSIIGAHNVQVLERDISMDSGFKEELRELMGSKDVRVPLAFIKGRLIGGADEVARLDEEGRLGILLWGIPRAGPGGCTACGGVRFVMCYECNGSCKLLGKDGRKSVKCGKCNENGLIVCPICC